MEGDRYLSCQRKYRFQCSTRMKSTKKQSCLRIGLTALFMTPLFRIRLSIAANSLSWRIQLPDAIKIICSTAKEGGKIVTEGSTTCIKYKDFENNKIRRSFSCQFHPELLSDLRGIGNSVALSYSNLKIDDGARLFVRLMYAGIQDAVIQA